jgi:hypothetical protein
LIRAIVFRHAEDDAGASAAPTIKKKRKRKSIGQGSLFKKKRPSADVAHASKQPLVQSSIVPDEPYDHEAIEEEAEPEQPNDAMNGDEPELPPARARPSDPRASLASNSQPLGRSAPSLVSNKKKRRKRKSIGQQSTRKRTSDTRARLSGEVRPAPEPSPAPSEPGSEAEDSTQGSLERELSSAPASPHSAMDKPDDSEDEDYEDDSREPALRPPPMRGAQRKKVKGRSTEHTTAARSLSSSENPPKYIKASFPITSHRLTDFDALPTINELGESELDSEDEREREAELRATLDRPTPNSVDVLGQYCRETLQAAIDALNVGTASDRAERKRKQAALEAVGRDLDDQLVDMSAAVENRIQLARRTRKAKKTKNKLQAHWLEIRRQREEVALECDHIRQQNWQREKDREQKWAISEAAHKLELEVERTDPDEEQQDGLEFLLRTIADDVSDISGNGLLSRVKSFNGQLERMAAVLEGRHV